MLTYMNLRDYIEIVEEILWSSGAFIFISLSFITFLLFFYFFPSLLSASFRYKSYKRIKFQIYEDLKFSRCLWQYLHPSKNKTTIDKNLNFFQYLITCKPCVTIATTAKPSYKGIPKDWKKIHCKQIPIINGIHFWVYKSRSSGL